MDSPPGHPGILRIVAPNPGPMTLAGTNTYLVGAAPCWVIDPGPDDPGHIAAVRDAAESRGGISGVVLTHSHADHSAAVEALGASLAWGSVAGGLETDWAQAASSASGAGKSLPRDPDAPASTEKGFPSTGPAAIHAGPFDVVPTPGHAADHVCFLWEGSVLFCGDLVLGEGSTIVPPASFGGSLADYMASLERIAGLGMELMAPGHGPWITDPQAKITEYLEHRRDRERRLRAALESGERSRERLLDAAWGDVPGPLRAAAALAMQAHLEKLEGDGLLEPDTTEP